MSVKPIKQNFKKHRKIIFLAFLQSVIVIIALGLFLYYKFYKPIYEDQYLFPEGHFQKVPELDIRKLNPDYIVQAEGLLDDKYGNRGVIDKKYGLTGREAAEKMKKGEKIYFIDVREIEEYRVGHIKGSKHLRGSDLTVNKVKEKFNLDQEQFENSLFILICHDGGRGLKEVQRLGGENIRYLIKGIEYGDVENIPLEITGPKNPEFKLFGRKYQTKYQMRAEDAIRLIKEDKDVVIIDGRHVSLYNYRHLKDSIHFKIGHMTTEEYDCALQKILKRKGASIIVLPDRYGELFYANLLFYRLENYYGFDDNKFHIVFNQFEKLKQSPDIEIIENPTFKLRERDIK